MPGFFVASNCDKAIRRKIYKVVDFLKVAAYLSYTEGVKYVTHT